MENTEDAAGKRKGAINLHYTRKDSWFMYKCLFVIPVDEV
jgi:hypothetical protein